MSAKHPIGDPTELVALYVAGAMTAEESTRMEAHLTEGCERCAAEMRQMEGVAAHLLDAVEPVSVTATTREAIFARVRGADDMSDRGDAAHLADSRQVNPQIWRDWESDRTAGDMFIVRAGESEWEPTGRPGIEARRLFVDRAGNRITMLVRMAPGTWYPGHTHGGPEECYVLQGDLRVADKVLHPGDYQRAAKGSQHGIQSTKNGCVLLLVSSLTDSLN